MQPGVTWQSMPSCHSMSRMTTDPSASSFHCLLDRRGGLSLRERRRLRTRATIKAEALRLFLEQGYKATTVEQIAAGIDISPRTFFRYYSSKEELLFEDEYDQPLIEAFRVQPPELSPILAFRHALKNVYDRLTEDEYALEEQRHTVLARTPELQTHSGQESCRNLDLLARLVAERLNRPPDDLEVRTVAGALTGVVLSCQAEGSACSLAEQLALIEARLECLETLSGGRER